MSVLIPLHNHDGSQAVMGRDLHAFLEVETQYNKWIDRMIEYGFSEGQDFLVKNVQNPNGGRPRNEHIISLDMAKEISMIQRSEKGKQARQYFIECERRANSPVALSRKEILTMALEAEERAELEAARADKAEARAEHLNEWKRATEAGDGLKLTDFRAKYFTSVPQMKFFEHLYRNRWIKDERGARRNLLGKKKPGPNHQQPLRKANDFLYRHEQGTYGDKKRLQTRVKPTNEIGFRDALIAEGLTPNTHSTGLVLISDEQMKELV